MPWCAYSGFATVFTGDIGFGSTGKNTSFQLVTYDNAYN